MTINLIRAARLWSVVLALTLVPLCRSYATDDRLDVGHQGAPGVQTANCGLNACMFVLGACHYEYSLSVLREVLVLEDAENVGVSLDKMVEALGAHRLEVQPRRSVPFASIKAWLRQSRDRYMILCTPPPEDEHVVGVGHASVLASVSDGVFLFADPWRSRTLSWDELEKRLAQRADWVDLFVSKEIAPSDGSGSMSAPDLRMDPSVIDLGQLEHGKTYERKVAVINAANRPLVVTRVAAGCTCGQIVLPKRYLTPGEAAEATVTVKADNWSAVTKTTQLFAFLADGTSARVEVSAKAPVSLRLAAVPSAVRLLAGDEVPTEPIIREIDIAGVTAEEPAKPLDISCSAPWLDAGIADPTSSMVPGHSTLSVRICVSEVPAPKSLVSRAEVRVTYPGIEHPLVVPVTIEWPKALQ